MKVQNRKLFGKNFMRILKLHNELVRNLKKKRIYNEFNFTYYRTTMYTGLLNSTEDF